MSLISIVPEKTKIVDGKVLFLFTCPKCQVDKEVNDFGIRKMASGQVKKQSWCRKCRTKLSPS